MAYRDVSLTGDADIRSFEGIESNLQPECENFILVYGGSFNPPHRGHIDVLLSGLRPEIGALAIIILPPEDYLLRHKMAKTDSNFFLTMQRRADLWAAISSVPRDKTWVWTNTFPPFGLMAEALIRLTKKDGLHLTFSYIIGPDNLNRKDPPKQSSR